MSQTPIETQSSRGPQSRRGKPAPAPQKKAGPAAADPREFRFYDNRQKYLLFVTTCSEKWVVAGRVGLELRHLHPSPPALRVFDAGIGDGTVLTQVMRDLHRRHPNVPFLITGKEVSLEDVRMSLEKMPDRFYEHPQMVMVITNMYYTEAPRLMPRSMAAAASLNWHEVPLKGSSAHEFDEQLKGLQPILNDGWQVRPSPSTGNPLYVRPSVIVLYREDHKFVLDQVIPRPGQTSGLYDLVIASQPYRARMPADFKVQRVLAPLARSLAPGGRMLVIHSCGNDPGIEIIRKLWPEDDPFQTNRHELLQSLRNELGREARGLNFEPYSDARSLFRYEMHTLPTEVTGSIGTSTLLAAWNAAAYVAQIDDQRFTSAISGTDYLDASAEVLRKHGGLWFNDESFVVSRKRN